MLKNVAELCTLAHEASKAKGFWNHDAGCAGDCDQASYNNHVCANRDLVMKVDLIHSELSEALEEFRMPEKKRGGRLGAVLFAKSDGTRSPNDVAPDAPASDGPRPRKPEGFLVELADAAIRIFDLTGRLGAGRTLQSGYLLSHTIAVEASRHRRFSENLADAHKFATLAYTHFRMNEAGGVDGLADLLALLEAMAAEVDGNLQEAIEIKMAYNATREFMHGKVC